MDNEEFELHKSIVEWLIKNGLSFRQAMTILNYALQYDMSLPSAYFELMNENVKNDCSSSKSIGNEG